MSKYLFNWELFDVVLGGKSALDTKDFLSNLRTKEQTYSFLSNYGFEQDDPVLKAELFGIFQEAIQFIRKYFLKVNNPDGIDLNIPNSLMIMTEVSDLFFMSSDKNPLKTSREDRLWAGIVLKVMHTILHADKDLRHNYFSFIQQQIFDRFYKFLKRDNDDQLYLWGEGEENRVHLYDFTTKAKKSRDSIIIKMLHKAENVAEELFDRIGVRFITHTGLDSLRVVKFLQEHNIIIPHNIKPSRSQNTLVNLKELRSSKAKLLKSALRFNYTEEKFRDELNQVIENFVPEISGQGRNTHSSQKYRSIHFTCRQLIKYKNPFMAEFYSLRKMAKEKEDRGEESELAKKILKMDLSQISKDTRFFYPFEVQIVDIKNHRINTEGEASHQEYKRNQLKTAMGRLFRPLIEYKKMERTNWLNH